MNLGKLLGAGKSFISGGKPAAYRLDKRVYLPQFISPKNPFVNPDSPANVESAAPPKKNKPAWAKTQKMSVAGAHGATARATTWASRLNPILIFSPAAAGKNATPFQAELSLEKVKVVHNDLTDADVEVVPMKSRPAREPAGEPQLAKSSWADLGQRIMKATAL